ncbi:hypothetical protein [Methanothermobacter tenebrarum]|uniref:hypothetical protein n=1 Tax=Methanothermobacter tenebrarum TaxID=680118 RepID=UPI0011BD0C5D|nr:hypothetical protein [Methanothermobacter tenebrarum]NPV64074.1 hypothetical protein [Methanobacteriaceae archaeon]
MPIDYNRLPIIYNRLQYYIVESTIDYNMKFLESMIKCYERKYKRNDRQYTTKQYTINLRKDDVECRLLNVRRKFA